MADRQGSTSDRKVALVTGASRGIGRAAALALASAGFDVAISARTVREGDSKATGRDGQQVTVPGSLESTAGEIEERGTRALAVPMDLLNTESLLAAPQQVIDTWGRLDVLVNNAIYQDGRALDGIMDLTADSMTKMLLGNYVHQVLLIQEVIPHCSRRAAAGSSTSCPGLRAWIRRPRRGRVAGASDIRRRRPRSPAWPAASTPSSTRAAFPRSTSTRATSSPNGARRPIRRTITRTSSAPSRRRHAATRSVGSRPATQPTSGSANGFTGRRCPSISVSCPPAETAVAVRPTA